MLFLGLWFGVAGYALCYAAIKGDKAKINGVPLWRAPWLPFTSALQSGGIGSAGVSSDSGAGGLASVTGGLASVTMLQNLRANLAQFRANLFARIGKNRPLVNV